MTNAEYSNCQLGMFRKQVKRITDPSEIKRDFITGTAAISGIGSIAFGFVANLPIALA